MKLFEVCLVPFIVNLSNNRSDKGWVEIKIVKVKRSGIGVVGLEKSSVLNNKNQ